MADTTFGVVLLNWNGFDDTHLAIESLLAADPQPAHVIVVDNGSTDGSDSRLAEWARVRGIDAAVVGADAIRDNGPLAWLTIILAGRNRGFAGGNNVGLAYLHERTPASHFLLLNNDALVAPDCFAALDAASRTGAGIVGCLIYHHPETSRVWFAGGFEDKLRGVALHLYDEPAGSTPYPTQWVTGCAMLISRQLFDEIGGLAECYYPIYCEDSDYSFRARESGETILMAPAAVVYHRVGGTVGTSETVPRVAYWLNRHRVFYVRRNYRGLDRAIALGYLVAAKPARAALLALKGRSAMASAVVRGLIDGLRDDPYNPVNRPQ